MRLWCSAQRFFCAAEMRRRAAALSARFTPGAFFAGATAGFPLSCD